MSTIPDSPEFDVDPPAAGEETPTFDDPVAAAAEDDEPDEPDPDEGDEGDED